MEPRAAEVEDALRFLRELRQLRNEAGLEPAELAARAHYPRHIIAAAEAGPSIPDLPVLSAYVRGCGGTLTEWEERWRYVTGSLAAAPCLPARPAGCSSLADAGARLGAAVSSNAEVAIPAPVLRLLSARAKTADLKTAAPETVALETAAPETVNPGATAPEATGGEAASAEMAPLVTAAAAVLHSSPLPAVRPGRPPAIRQAGIPRAVLAAIVTAAMVVHGAIRTLLRRRSRATAR